jgi:hypothetical protein
MSKKRSRKKSAAYRATASHPNAKRNHAWYRLRQGRSGSVRTRKATKEDLERILKENLAEQTEAKMSAYSPSKKLDIERTMKQLGSVEGSWQELMDVFPAYATTIKKHFHIMEAEGKIARIRPEPGRQRWKYEWIGPDEVEESGE